MDHKPELDPIERILASEEKLVPSSGFVATVMERVHEESRLPPPIPFPWKRAIPGIVLTAGVFGWGSFEMVQRVPSALKKAPLTLNFPAAGPGIESAGWVAVALAVSMLAWLLSRRLAGRSGLL